MSASTTATTAAEIAENMSGLKPVDEPGRVISDDPARVHWGWFALLAGVLVFDLVPSFFAEGAHDRRIRADAFAAGANYGACRMWSAALVADPALGITSNGRVVTANCKPILAENHHG